MTPSPDQIAVFVAFVVGLAAAHAGSLLTKAHAPAWVKAPVTFALATAAGVIPTVVWAPGDDWVHYAYAVFAALLAQVAAHYTGTTNLIAAKTAGFGLDAPHRQASPKAPAGTSPSSS